MTPTDLLNDLLIKGGAIVCTEECTDIEIANAQNTERFCIFDDDCGLIRRTKRWLDLQKRRELRYPNNGELYEKN